MKNNKIKSKEILEIFKERAKTKKTKIDLDAIYIQDQYRKGLIYEDLIKLKNYVDTLKQNL